MFEYFWKLLFESKITVSLDCREADDICGEIYSGIGGVNDG